MLQGQFVKESTLSQFSRIKRRSLLTMYRVAPLAECRRRPGMLCAPPHAAEHRTLYNAALVLPLPLLPSAFVARASRARYRAASANASGRYAADAPHPRAKSFWIHAVSLGEDAGGRAAGQAHRAGAPRMRRSCSPRYRHGTRGRPRLAGGQ